jgi:hypothetical protein
MKLLMVPVMDNTQPQRLQVKAFGGWEELQAVGACA